MIKVASRTLITATAGSSHDIVNMDQIEGNLADTLTRAGGTDPILVKDITHTIERFVENRINDNEPCSLNDVYTLINDILLGIGRHDAADLFRRRHDLKDATIRSSIHRHDPEEIRQIIAADDFFTNKDVDSIWPDVESKLDALNIAAASQALVRELARSIWRSTYIKESVAQQATEQQTPWLYTACDIERWSRECGDNLFRSGILSASPVSATIPAVDLRLHLAAVAKSQTTSTLLDLDILTALPDICADLHRLVDVIADRIRSAATIPSSEDIRFILHLDVPADAYPDATATVATALRRDAAAAIRTSFANINGIIMTIR